MANDHHDIPATQSHLRANVLTWVLAAIVGIPLLLAATCIGGGVWHWYRETAIFPTGVRLCRTSASVVHLCLDSNDIVVSNVMGWECKGDLVYGESVSDAGTEPRVFKFFIYDHARRHLDSTSEKAEWLNRLSALGVPSGGSLRRP